MNDCSLLHLLYLITLAAAMFEVCGADIYTSSKKIEDMVLQEEEILNGLHSAISSLGNESVVSMFSRFYRERMLKVQERVKEKIREILKHPNGVYQNIKQFSADYGDIRAALELIGSDSIQGNLSCVASPRDVEGARRSFLRLQDVYNLKAHDIIRGELFGFAGPELSDLDALEIGRIAFIDGKLNSATAWLREALEMTQPREFTAGFVNSDVPAHLTAEILALLGRVYVRQGEHSKATEMFRKSASIDRANVQVKELEQELQSHPQAAGYTILDANYCRLCSLQEKLSQNKFNIRLRCRYRKVQLPYYRFKMELISVSPYVALFYEVITDYESQHFIDLVKNKISRGTVNINGTSIFIEGRTSHMTYAANSESPHLDNVAKRIAGITDLDTAEHLYGEAYAAEPFQVVNYGIGGHYSPHFDFLDQENIRNKYLAEYGGNRLATFLLYLTVVERGGSTVFPSADIAVRPVKNMGLFWYNYKPSGEKDLRTLHAACPVVIGHKWVTNKWMWNYGNTFTRRCGLEEDSTQLDIDKYMRRGWA